MTDTAVPRQDIEVHGLTLDEYHHVRGLLGREPTFVELGIVGVMWSEHCSYKSSRVHLERLPTSGKGIVQGPGENAGIVEIGDGWCVAFKIESHNHPSFIEPYQGAATGVGGILRDIFTMGARPVAAMNSLRFGPLDNPANRSIMAGVVKGIGDYGNSFGVPTTGGEVSFSKCYSKNPLVNAFALGLVRKDQIFLGRASGTGNAVMYVGAKTGRDGIHGATMASAEFDDQALAKRPHVQVGDPFMEKLLLEACLEALRTGAVGGMQDMGAAGLTCSSCEMGARGGTGIEIDLDLVPQREQGMTAYEIMLSESQERMLLVVKRGHERQVMDIFNKWDLDAVVVGTVTDTGHLVVRHQGSIVASLPNKLLTDEAPVYQRPVHIPTPRTKEDQVPAWLNTVSDESCSDQLHSMLSSPNLCSRQWVSEQYDHMVRTNSFPAVGGDASVIRVKETRRAVAMTLDGQNRYCRLNPREGVKLIVAEAARNLVCVGAQPLAITNCLNFASPEHPEVMGSFSEVIDGMAESCQVFGTPVTGGNVSFYNETDGRGVDPTPVIGMVGVIADVNDLTTHHFKDEGDLVVMLGETNCDMTGTEFMSTIYGDESGPIPSLDLDKERAVHDVCLEAIRGGLVKSAHDCSDGGLAVTLAESCFSGGRLEPLGVEIDAVARFPQVPESHVPAVFLFSESPSRIVVSVDPANLEPLESTARRRGVPMSLLGRVWENRFVIRLNGKTVVDEPVSVLESLWRDTLPAIMDIVGK